MNALALSRLDVRSTDKVLEVGFGGGSLLAQILAAGPAEAIGIDLSEAMVERGRRRFRRHICQGRARIASGSVEQLPLKDNAVDKACSLNTIYFWKDPAAAVRELARVVRPGGALVLGFEAPETLRAWPGHRYGFTIWEPDEVIALAADAGFGKAGLDEGLEPKFGKIYCMKAERL
jgi:ubiquinone/menaquinone biosynthesis C-methylase UbiE